MNPEAVAQAGVPTAGSASSAPRPAARRRIGLVEDDPLIREKFARAMRKSDRFELWFETGSVQGALEWMANCSAEGWPEIWLVDLGLPDGSGLTVIQQALGTHGPTLVLVISIFADDEAIIGALHAGAMGFIQKGDGDDELLEHLDNATQGGAPISPRIAARLLESFKRSVQEGTAPLTGHDAVEQEPEPASALTAREKAVLNCLSQGHSYEEAAASLHMSLNTLRQHVRGTYAKLGVHSKIDAINVARKRRWLATP